MDTKSPLIMCMWVFTPPACRGGVAPRACPARQASGPPPTHGSTLTRPVGANSPPRRFCLPWRGAPTFGCGGRAPPVSHAMRCVLLGCRSSGYVTCAFPVQCKCTRGKYLAAAQAMCLMTESSTPPPSQPPTFLLLPTDPPVIYYFPQQDFCYRKSISPLLCQKSHRTQRKSPSHHVFNTGLIFTAGM